MEPASQATRVCPRVWPRCPTILYLDLHTASRHVFIWDDPNLAPAVGIEPTYNALTVRPHTLRVDRKN